MTEEALAQQPRRSRLLPPVENVADWPWWLILFVLIGLFIAIQIIVNARINVIFSALLEGIRLTLTIALSAYVVAITIGLFVGLGRISKNPILYNIASFYVEIIRGVPMLVLMLYIAFVGVSLTVGGLNELGQWLVDTFGVGAALTGLTSRSISFTTRVILALGIGYGAFSAEIFRAGIESIERGQMEAARSLGMTYAQAMRYVILPQAVRRVLPALGNDFVAMIKDSSLAAFLGVREMTQIAKLYSASTFLYMQTYTMLAFLYLILTISLTRLVRLLERRLSRDRRVA